MSAILEIKALTKEYDRGPVRTPALRGISLATAPGDFVAIMGPSGSGKSTLLQILGALDAPTAGEVWYAGNRIDRWGVEPGATRFRQKHLGFVFQSFNLVRSLTARENVGLPLVLQGAAPKLILAQTELWLRRVGLWERRDHRPFELSGGEQQRVAIARALIHDPAILLADEPTGNLDSQNGEQVMRLFEELCRESGKTIILVTHDPIAASYARRVVHLRDGLLSGAFDFAPVADRAARIQTVLDWLRRQLGGEQRC